MVIGAGVCAPRKTWLSSPRRRFSNRKDSFPSKIRKRLGTRREALEQLAVNLYAGVLSNRDAEVNPSPSRSNLDQRRFLRRERGLAQQNGHCP
jgi:hypothetical protein